MDSTRVRRRGRPRRGASSAQPLNTYPQQRPGATTSNSGITSVRVELASGRESVPRARSFGKFSDVTKSGFLGRLFKNSVGRGGRPRSLARYELATDPMIAA